MAIKETRGVMAYKDDKGDLNIHYPVTEAGLTTYDPKKSGLPAESMQAAADVLAKLLGDAFTGIMSGRLTTPLTGRDGVAITTRDGEEIFALKIL